MVWLEKAIIVSRLPMYVSVFVVNSYKSILTWDSAFTEWKFHLNVIDSMEFY